MDGYLSRDRDHLNKQQRARRAREVRIDYRPSPEALAIIEARRGPQQRLSVSTTNSAIVNAILVEWANAAGIQYRSETTPKTSDVAPELSDHSARARMTSDIPAWAAAWLAENSAEQAKQRVKCGARRHRDGQPCEAKSEPGKRRCRFHGGRSTGPRTPEGKSIALANLQQFQKGRRVARGDE